MPPEICQKVMSLDMRKALTDASMVFECWIIINTFYKQIYNYIKNRKLNRHRKILANSLSIKLVFKHTFSECQF